MPPDNSLCSSVAQIIPAFNGEFDGLRHSPSGLPVAPNHPSETGWLLRWFEVTGSGKYGASSAVQAFHPSGSPRLSCQASGAVIGDAGAFVRVPWLIRYPEAAAPPDEPVGWYVVGEQVHAVRSLWAFRAPRLPEGAQLYCLSLQVADLPLVVVGLRGLAGVSSHLV